jgi:hypothetical protein
MSSVIAAANELLAAKAEIDRLEDQQPETPESILVLPSPEWMSWEESEYRPAADRYDAARLGFLHAVGRPMGTEQGDLDAALAVVNGL